MKRARRGFTFRELRGFLCICTQESHLIGRLRAELARHRHQLVEVVEACPVLRVIRVFKLRAVAGGVKKRVEQLPQIRLTRHFVDHARNLRAHALHHLVEFAYGIHCPCAKPGNLARCRIAESSPKANTKVLRVQSNLCLCLVTNSALRHVDNAAQAHRVIRIIHDAQVGHQVPDLAAFVETRATDHLVRDARAHENILQCARSIVGAVHNRNIRIGRAFIR